MTLRRMLGEYFRDIEKAIRAGRRKKDAQTDPAFKKIDEILSPLIKKTQFIEYQNVCIAKKFKNSWTKALKKIGKNGVIDVQGKASKAVAKRYISINKDMIDGVYRPSYQTLVGIGFWFETKKRNKKLTKMNSDIEIKINEFKKIGRLG